MQNDKAVDLLVSAAEVGGMGLSLVEAVRVCWDYLILLINFGELDNPAPVPYLHANKLAMT